MSVFSGMATEVLLGGLLGRLDGLLKLKDSFFGNGLLEAFFFFGKLVEADDVLLFVHGWDVDWEVG